MSLMARMSGITKVRRRPTRALAVSRGGCGRWVLTGAGEYVFMFWMDGEGKIERCVEMLDSLATTERLLVLSARAKENMKTRTGEEFRWLEKE
jgi:hypothetical protein